MNDTHNQKITRRPTDGKLLLIDAPEIPVRNESLEGVGSHHQGWKKQAEERFQKRVVEYEKALTKAIEEGVELHIDCTPQVWYAIEEVKVYDVPEGYKAEVKEEHCGSVNCIEGACYGNICHCKNQYAILTPVAPHNSAHSFTEGADIPVKEEQKALTLQECWNQYRSKQVSGADVMIQEKFNEAAQLYAQSRVDAMQKKKEAEYKVLMDTSVKMNKENEGIIQSLTQKLEDKDKQLQKFTLARQKSLELVEHTEKLTEMYEKLQQSTSDKIQNLTQKLEAVLEATEDKNGQFRAWHQHLRKVTQEARTLINQSK